jgi:hypothetical protein
VSKKELKILRLGIWWAMPIGAVVALVAGKGNLATSSIFVLCVLGAMGSILAMWEHGWLKAPVPLGTPLRVIVLTLLPVALIALIGWWAAIPSTVPDFKPRIDWAHFTTDDNVNHSIPLRGAYLLVGVTVENRGAPSAFSGIAAYLKLASGETIPAVISGPPSNQSMTLNYTSGISTTLYRDDYLVLHENNPIVTNSALPAWVALLFPNRSLRELDNSVLRITFTDYNNKESHIESPKLSCGCSGSH